MKFSVVSALALLTLSAQATPLVERAIALPWKLPFSTSGSKILSADGKVVKHVGTNWPAHQQAMIPEGLQYSSIKDVVTKIRGFGLNTVRLTFAIEMIDDIIDKGKDVTLQDTLNKSLGVNATKVLNQILSKNPVFTAKTTRLQVFDAVAQELNAQGLYLHLDNHVSKAIWCCGGDDGNAWFGDRYFDVAKWIRGWGYISAHAAKNWPSFSSMGLRNEPRKADGGRGEPYDYITWYNRFTAAAAAAHKGAPDALIYFSGMDYDTKIGPIPSGSQLTGTSGTSTAGKTAYFVPSSFPYQNKIVLELHKYDHSKTQASCSKFGGDLQYAGFFGLGGPNASPKPKYVFPMLLTEWGFAQDGSYYKDTTYNKCLIEFMQKTESSGWMQWDIAGSYYQRTDKNGDLHDNDEAWGLLNHNWSAVRSQKTVDNSLKPMIKAILG